MHKAARLLITAIIALYLIACIVGLIIAANGFFGHPSSPLGAVFGLFLAAPWTLLFGLPPETDSPAASMLTLLAYMGLNLVILWLIRRAIGKPAV